MTDYNSDAMDNPARTTADLTAKGYVQPSIRLAYTSNQEMIQCYAADYVAMMREIVRGAQACGQEVVGLVGFDPSKFALSTFVLTGAVTQDASPTAEQFLAGEVTAAEYLAAPIAEPIRRVEPDPELDALAAALNELPSPGALAATLGFMTEALDEVSAIPAHEMIPEARIAQQMAADAGVAPESSPYSLTLPEFLKTIAGWGIDQRRAMKLLGVKSFRNINLDEALVLLHKADGVEQAEQRAAEQDAPAPSPATIGAILESQDELPTTSGQQHDIHSMITRAHFKDADQEQIWLSRALGRDDCTMRELAKGTAKLSTKELRHLIVELDKSKAMGARIGYGGMMHPESFTATPEQRKQRAQSAQEV